MWCIPHLLWGNEMRNKFVNHINAVVISKFLAKAVIQQAASRHPEIIESRDRGEARFLAFVAASARKVYEAIERIGSIDAQGNMDGFKAAIDKEVELLIDAGLVAFNNAPPEGIVEPMPGQPVH